MRGSREVGRSRGEEKRRGEKRKKWGMIDRDICLSSSSSVFCLLSISLSLYLSLLDRAGVYISPSWRERRGEERGADRQTDSNSTTKVPPTPLPIALPSMYHIL